MYKKGNTILSRADTSRICRPRTVKKCHKMLYNSIRSRCASRKLKAFPEMPAVIRGPLKQVSTVQGKGLTGQGEGGTEW